MINKERNNNETYIHETEKNEESALGMDSTSPYANLSGLSVVSGQSAFVQRRRNKQAYGKTINSCYKQNI